jgi:hypothetical protein
LYPEPPYGSRPFAISFLSDSSLQGAQCFFRFGAATAQSAKVFLLAFAFFTPILRSIVEAGEDEAICASA